MEENHFRLPEPGEKNERPSLGQTIRMALILMGFTAWLLFMCAAVAGKIAEAFGR